MFNVFTYHSENELEFEVQRNLSLEKVLKIFGDSEDIEWYTEVISNVGVNHCLFNGNVKVVRTA